MGFLEVSIRAEYSAFSSYESYLIAIGLSGLDGISECDITLNNPLPPIRLLITDSEPKTERQDQDDDQNIASNKVSNNS